MHNPYSYSDMDWAAQLDPAYAAARTEVRRLSVGELRVRLYQERDQGRGF